MVNNIMYIYLRRKLWLTRKKRRIGLTIVLLAGSSFTRLEQPLAFPTISAEVFAAKALILRELTEKLTPFIDIPWCKAGLFYIQKLVLCIEAYGIVTWKSESISQ